MAVEPIAGPGPNPTTPVEVRAAALAVADAMLADHGGQGAPDYKAVIADIAQIEQRDPVLGGEVRAVVEEQLSIVERVAYAQAAAEASQEAEPDAAFSARSDQSARDPKATAQRQPVDAARQARIIETLIQQSGGPRDLPTVTVVQNGAQTAHPAKSGALANPAPTSGAHQVATALTAATQAAAKGASTAPLAGSPAPVAVDRLPEFQPSRRLQVQSLGALILVRGVEGLQSVLSDCARFVGTINAQWGQGLQSFLLARGWIGPEQDPRKVLRRLENPPGNRGRDRPCRADCPSWSEYEPGHWRCLECGASSD